MKMLGVRNERQESQQREGVCPPQGARSQACAVNKKRSKIRCHQREDQQRDPARLPGKLSEPPGPNKKPPNEEAGDAHGASQSKGCGKIKIHSSDASRGVEKSKAED